MVTSCSNKRYGSAATRASARGGTANGDSGDEVKATDDSPPEKKFRDLILAQIWLELDDAIAQNGGSCYGMFSKILKKHQQKFKWLNRDYLNNYRRQATKEFKLPPHQT